MYPPLPPDVKKVNLFGLFFCEGSFVVGSFLVLWYMEVIGWRVDYPTQFDTGGDLYLSITPKSPSESVILFFTPPFEKFRYSSNAKKTKNDSNTFEAYANRLNAR
ncbi:Hypothetical protein LBF_2455 [Leptospira biflexa serovar Patoc strain 'Patoc 1 (Ames)']|nr:Hypothetical protein LBF_2455 [Leptospira biflexa serovar Patoc strain 'Patoc 1 (Ames)']